MVVEPILPKPVPKKLTADPGVVDCDATDAEDVGVRELLASNWCWRAQTFGYRTRFQALGRAVRAREALAVKAARAAQ